MIWPESIQRKVATSVARYNNYLNSELISHEEIPKFKKQWMVRALEQIQTELLEDEQVYK
jgi:dynein heavy chain, axonemal